LTDNPSQFSQTSLGFGLKINESRTVYSDESTGGVGTAPNSSELGAFAVVIALVLATLSRKVKRVACESGTERETKPSAVSPEYNRIPLLQT
jgi:hypothetical protein